MADTNTSWLDITGKALDMAGGIAGALFGQQASTPAAATPSGAAPAPVSSSIGGNNMLLIGGIGLAAVLVIVLVLKN